MSRFDQAASTSAEQTKGAGKHTQNSLEPRLSCTAPPSVHNWDSPLAKATASGSFSKTMASGYPLPEDTNDFAHSARDFFWDTPWGNVPSHRLGNITAIPVLPRGRLLGGSSKLAALAAARKKKKEAASPAPAGTQVEEAKAETDAAVALLDKLSVSKDANGSSNVDNPQKRSGSFQTRYPRKRPESPKPAVPEPEEPSLPEEMEPVVQVPRIRTGPSMFASTLCGTGQSTKNQEIVLSTVPLPSLPHDPASRRSFTGPSPDDVVLRAQSQGAVHGLGR